MHRKRAATLLAWTLLGSSMMAEAVQGETLAYWRFEEGSGTSIADSSAHGNDGSLLNGVAFSGDVGVLQVPLTNAPNLFSLELDGADDIGVVADSGSLRPQGSLTLEALIKPAAGARVIVGKQLFGGCCVNSYQLELNPFRFQLTDSSGNDHLIGPGFNPPVDEWIHVAGTWDGATMRLYLNGTEVSNGPFFGPIGYDMNPLLIGGEDDGGGIPGCCLFRGHIDEVRLSDRALHPSEFLIADRCEEDLADCRSTLSLCEEGLDRALSELALCQADLEAAAETIADLQAQIADLFAQLDALQQENVNLRAALVEIEVVLSRLEADFREVFRDPDFLIPGTTTVERLESLAEAILRLNRGRKTPLYTELGGER